jgi:ABC-type multidrug transport system fused ATPase/permease subunit
LITGVFVFLLYFDFKTTVIMGSFFSFSLIAYNLIVGRKINSLGNIVMQNDALKIKQITESILSYIQIKLGKSQNFFLDKFNHPNRKVSESLAVQFSLRQLPKYYFEFLLYSFLLLLVMFYDDNGQNELITKIGVYIASLLKAIPSLNRITGSIQSIKFSQSSIERLTSLNFNLNEDLNLAQLQLNEGLFLDHITFSYVPGENILQDLSISIPKNSALGIIGESGVGKSTLVNIMLGNLFPLSGSIKVDDIELTKNNISSWQSKIGYVSQKIYLLDESIVNNIAFGVLNDKIDINKVKEVMKLAEISSLEEKFDIINDNVGEDGSKLSGGQIQRLGLARALYTDPEILFFDEFTSALDDKTEQKILKDIEKLKDKKTIIIISHKESILNFCDQILDMNKQKHD